MVGALGYAQKSSGKAIKGNNLPPPARAFFVGGEVDHFCYPVFRERSVPAFEDPPTERLYGFTISALASGEMFDGLLEVFCAEI